MSIFKKLPLPKTRPPLEKINLDHLSEEDKRRISNRAGKGEGHRKGASFHFRTVIIQGKMILIDGNDEIIKVMDVRLKENMSEKEQERLVLEVKTELRSIARDLFINYNGDTIQIGGFLFD